MTVATNPRPRQPRGTAQSTRARLVEVAAQVFNRDGLLGTDTNRLAHEAGYAPGTFYKHFKDKKEIFLAVHQELVTAEWRMIEGTIRAGGSAPDLARNVVQLVLGHQTRWQGFRQSMAVLVCTDEGARKAFHEARSNQLDGLSMLAKAAGAAEVSREEDASLFLTMERLVDAVATGEADAMGLRKEAVLEHLEALIQARLTARPKTHPGNALPPA